MELNGLEFVGVQSGVVAMTSGNVGVLSNNVVTVSYNAGVAKSATATEAVFTATFVSTKAGNVGDMIDVTSKVTPAEAYVGERLEVRDVTISTRGEIEEVGQTALYQNEPNPFREVTVIGFDLETAGKASLTISDVTGRVVSQQDIEGVRGYNSVSVNAKDLGTSGVLYYTLESGEFSATRKMIIVR